MGAALVNSVSQAMHILARLDDQGMFSDVTWRQESREAVANVLYGRMAARVAAHLEDCRHEGRKDRRNGSYTRHVLTALGDLALEVPRTRTFNPSRLLTAYARRAPEIDRMILAAFVLGLSTRKVGKVVLRLLGEPVSAATVSQVAKQLDTEVAAFHRRPLKDQYRVLMFDGVVLARKTGAGATRSRTSYKTGVAIGVPRLDSRQGRAAARVHLPLPRAPQGDKRSGAGAPVHGTGDRPAAVLSSSWKKRNVLLCCLPAPGS